MRIVRTRKGTAGIYRWTVEEEMAITYFLLRLSWDIIRYNAEICGRGA
jgi:hypothetical protein